MRNKICRWQLLFLVLIIYKHQLESSNDFVTILRHHCSFLMKGPEISKQWVSCSFFPECPCRELEQATYDKSCLKAGKSFLIREIRHFLGISLSLARSILFSRDIQHRASFQPSYELCLERLESKIMAFQKCSIKYTNLCSFLFRLSCCFNNCFLESYKC